MTSGQFSKIEIENWIWCQWAQFTIYNFGCAGFLWSFEFRAGSQLEKAMFARSAVSCLAGGGCSADFTDRCHSCTLSLRGLCLESHACTPYAPLQYVTFDGPLVEATPPSKEHFVYTPLTSSNSSSVSSSSSATSTSSSSSLTKSVTNFDVPIAKKRKTAAAVLVREPIRNYFSTSQTAPLCNSSDVTLVMAKSNSTMSWVWESFLKFDPVKHPGMKNFVYLVFGENLVFRIFRIFRIFRLWWKTALSSALWQTSYYSTTLS